jgi:hypothetical protein
MITKKEQLQKIVKEYREAGQSWPATTEEIAQWAVVVGKYDLTAPTLVRHCARELAQAMRDEYITDPKGRRVRAKHPAKVEVDGQLQMVWDDIRTAPRQHMQLAFRLRRRRIATECKQVKADVDSYNDAHPKDIPIQMPLDFTYDVEEMELAEA